MRYRLTFSDDRTYQADISLASRQEVASFVDVTDVDAADAAFRFSFGPGLQADRLFWRSNHYAQWTTGLDPQPIDFSTEHLLLKLCPWTYWWLEGQASYAGFFRDGAEPLVGLITMRPSRWTPTEWGGFARTAIPIMATKDGQLELTLPLLALSPQAAGAAARPMHRELGLTVGTVAEHVTQDVAAVKLRTQLLKYGEFPLDEVKDFHFELARSKSKRQHPYLLFTQADIERARRQAKVVPMFKADFEAAALYLTRLGCDPVAKIQSGPDGWLRFFTENYVGNGLYGVAPQAFLGSDDPKYGIILAAGVKGLTRQHVDMFLNAPQRPTLGGNAHMAGTTMLRLLLAYDAIADSGLLTEKEKAEVEAALVFGGYVFDHPDYWNCDVGLCSANPNMTSLLRLPLGLVGVYLDGHPQAEHWLEFAESELRSELDNWIAPGGAWLECPMYQAPSLDGMFLLAQALKNVKGRDYFSDPQFKATMDYYGFIQTAPDLRFPPVMTSGVAPPMTVPSIGDAFPCFTHPFNGWMTRVTAQTDPAYSARQQAYWAGQSFSCLNGGRAGFIPALVDAELPATPPAATARAFEGFGNVLRTSWTDPRSSYVSHRCGYYTHHYDPGDHNSFMYYAKGVPLCMDFGHRGAKADEVRTMWKPMYHNTVSFDRPDSELGYWPSSPGGREENRAGQEVRSLPRVADYSRGRSVGIGGQVHLRHLLLVKSDDPTGATYLVARDQTVDGQPQQTFTWSLWCMAGSPEISGSLAHFPGQFGVDLDVQILQPAGATLIPDSLGYEQWVNPWGKFREDQTGIHTKKTGSESDFFAVLYPRAQGQAAAQVEALAGGAACRIRHMEGADLLLFSPGKPATVTDGELSVQGEMALARHLNDGGIRLALISDESSAACGEYRLAGRGPVSLLISKDGLSGESDGPEKTVVLGLPAGAGEVAIHCGGSLVASERNGQVLSFVLPAGAQHFVVEPAK